MTLAAVSKPRTLPLDSRTIFRQVKPQLARAAIWVLCPPLLPHTPFPCCVGCEVAAMEVQGCCGSG